MAAGAFHISPVAAAAFFLSAASSTVAASSIPIDLSTLAPTGWGRCSSWRVDEVIVLRNELQTLGVEGWTYYIKFPGSVFSPTSSFVFSPINLSSSCKICIDSILLCFARKRRHVAHI